MKKWKKYDFDYQRQGQFGTELRHLLDEQGTKYVATDVKDLDITDAEATMTFISEMKPTLIYHCAAYTAVDKAENEGKDLDEAIKIAGTRNLALAAKVADATFVHVSSDYVFDGKKKDDMYRVDDVTDPLNEYGHTKLLGEEAVAETLEKYYTIRTSCVFGQYGCNFVYTMQNLAKTHDTLTVVTDQFGRPT